MKAILLGLASGVLMTGTSQVFSGEPNPNPGGAKQPGAPLEPAPAAHRDHFRVSGGWMWRQIGGVNFHSGSESQNTRLPSFFGRGQHDPMIGSANLYAERIYADGFVKVDAGTASDGATSNWGYQNSTQVRGSSLDFHASGTRRMAGDQTHSKEAGDWGFDGSGGAPVVQFEWQHDLNSIWSAGLQTQWSWLGFDGDHRGTNFSASQSGSDFRLNFTDSFDLQGITPPAAPYQGSGAGNGPLLNNLPSNRSRVETQTGGGRMDFVNDIRESLEVDVNTISIGPTLTARLGSVNLQLAAGLAVNIASWDATHDESLFLSRNGRAATKWKQWHARDSGTDVLPGFYVQGAVTASLSDRLTLTGFGRYEWSRTLDGTVGPSAFSVNLSGWSVGALVGITF